MASRRWRSIVPTPSNWQGTSFLSVLATAMLCWATTGCGAGSSANTVPQVSVSIFPTTATVPIGTFQPFSAYAAGTTSTAVTWRVSAGSIDQSGNYTAPSSPPPGGTATVTATSVSAPSVSASASVSVTTQPVTLNISPTSATTKAGFSQSYTATVGGTTNNLVAWSVSDLPGDSGYPGSISGGYYTAPLPFW